MIKHFVKLSILLSGIHSEISSSKVKTLTIIDHQTFFLPIGLHENFPNLIEMSVIRSRLFEIEPDKLSGMLNLESLNFTQNKLRKIKADTFNDQNELIQLDLSFNKIEVVCQRAFHGLSKLENL